MDYEFIFNKKDFADMISKMGVPLNFSNKKFNSKKGFIYPVIFPKITPIWEGDNYIKSTID
jgi:hypothetical protein